MILGVVLAFMLLATIYLIRTPAQYSAETVVLLDKGVTNTISGVSSLNLTNYEPAAIDSEVQILRSKRVTDGVVELIEPKGYFSYLPLDQDRRDFILFKNIQGGLSVSRIEQTYALSIKYKSTDPQEAADMANAFAEVYISDQLNSLSETSQRTTKWLQDKATEIKEKSNTAREHLAEYRLKYNTESQKNIKKRKKDSEFNQDIHLREFRDLEQEIDTYDKIYESYLQKIRTISLEQSFPVTETRVITAATAPLGKSEPKSAIIMGAALILGAGIGVLLALILDFFDKTLKRAGQVRRELEFEFFGFLPKIKPSSHSTASFISPKNKSIALKLYAQVVDDEHSLCADTIKTIKNVLDVEPSSARNKIIGVLSTFEDNDTQVISSNLALQYAHDGRRALLINGDLQNSRGLKAKGQKHNAPFYTPEDAQDFLLSNTCYNEQYNLHVIDTLTPQAPKASEKFNVQKVEALFNICRDQYDYTIINLPPLHAASDLHNYLQSIDHLVLVAEWGKTLPNTLNFYLEQNRIDSSKISGLVLSKANMKKLKSHYGHREYRHES